MAFGNIGNLLLLLLLIPYVVWYVLKWRINDATLRISDARVYSHTPKSYKNYLIHLPFILRLIALILLIVVLARPQATDSWQNSEIEGVDIVLAMDVSTSMLAEDLVPNRLEAAKEVAAKFVQGRETDNIGLVVFAGECFTQTPMTNDKTILLNSINSLEMGMLEDGTAIGDGLATAINRIVDGKAKSKSIILLTDGSNNTGLVAPETAADIAREKGIKVYTIGVGSNGSALSPVGINYYGKIEYDYLKVTIDEKTLKSIADKTGGRYYRATDNQALENIFSEIDALEKTTLDVKNYRNVEDDYMLWAWLLLAFVGIDLLRRNTLLRTMP